MAVVPAVHMHSCPTGALYMHSLNCDITALSKCCPEKQKHNIGQYRDTVHG